MGCLKGCAYCLLWYSSILAGYAGLFCPLLPILFFSNKLYRFATDVLFSFWQYYPTALLEILCGCEVQLSGDPILSGETSLVVMNHRTRTDWNFLWPMAYHCVTGPGRYKHSTKFVLKDIIKHIPGPGWVMQLSNFIYIKRSWSYDKQILQEIIGYFYDISYKYTLIMFPEGTDLTETTKNNSNKFAEKNNLQKYEYVLHPKTTGFTYLASELVERDALDAIYDLTIVYPDAVPQSEKMFLKGIFPKQIKIHLARYPAAIVPRTAEGLKQFLEDRWREKEKVLREFHATGQFLHGQILKRSKKGELWAALIFWSLLPHVVLYFFLFADWFRQLVLAHTAFLLTINVISDGFHKFETGVGAFRKRIFGRSF